jgi:hypothetical protein
VWTDYQPPFIDRPDLKLLDGELECGLFVRRLVQAEERGLLDEAGRLKVQIGFERWIRLDFWPRMSSGLRQRAGDRSD